MCVRLGPEAGAVLVVLAISVIVVDFIIVVAVAVVGTLIIVVGSFRRYKSSVARK